MSTTPTKSAPNWPKRVGYSVITCLLLVIVILCVVRLALKSSWGLGIVERQIEAMAPAGQLIGITGMKGDLLGLFEIEQLTVSDGQGQWMRAQDIQLAWSPWAMLRRRLVIDTVSTEAVDVTRRPAIIATDEPLPIEFRSYELKAFNLGILNLSEQIVGRKVSITAAGGFSHSDAGGKLVLDGRTLDQAVTDRADINIKWSPEFLLTGKADIIGPAGGLIQNSLNLKSTEALEINLKSQGQIENITTSLNARLGSNVIATSEILKRSDSAEITAVISPSTLPGLEASSDYLGGEAKVEAIVQNLSKSPTVRAKITAPNLNGSLTANKTGEAFDISNIDMVIRDPLSQIDNSPATLQSVRITGAATYGEAISFTGRILANDIRYDSYEMRTISGPATLNLDSPRLSFSVDLTGELAGQEELKSTFGGSPKIRADGLYNLNTQTIDLSKLDARLAGLLVQAAGRLDMQNTVADLKGSFDIKKGVLGGRIPADFAGRFTTDTQGQNIALNIDSRAENFDPFPAPANDIIGDAAKMTARVLIEPETRNVQFPRFTVVTASATVSGSGRYNSNGVLGVKADYKIGTFSVGTTNVSDVSGVFNADGKMGALSFGLSGNSTKIQTPQLELTNAEYTASGKQRGDGVEAEINIKALRQGEPANLKTDVTYNGNRWSASNTTGRFAGLDIAGDLSGVGGDITLLSGQFNLTGDPSVFIPAEAVDLNLSLTEANAKIEGKITGLSSGPLTGADINIEAAGPREAVAFTVSVNGDTEFADITREVDLTATGGADLRAPLGSLTTDLSGRLGTHEIKTLSPLSFSQTPNGLIGDGELSFFGGSTIFNLATQPQTLRLKGTDLKVAPLMTFIGRAGLEGLTGFEAEFTKSPTGIEGTATASLSSLRQPGSDVEPLDATLKADLMSEMLNVDIQTMSGELTGNATLEGRINTLTSPPFISWPPQTPLRGVAKANGDLGALAELFLPPETDIAGDLALDLKYSVPLDARGLNGTLSLTGGSMEQGTIGLKLEDMSLASEFKGTAISVSNFSAQDTKGGSINGSGQMDIGAIDGSAVKMSARKLHIFDRREGFAVLSGELGLTHNGELLSLDGNLIVDEATVSIDKFPRAGRPTLDVNFSSDDQEDDSTPQTATKLNLKISSPGRIKLRGRGVDALMALEAKVGGAFNDPILSGEASITRGQFDFLGKKFDLKDSQVIFSDEIMDSRLYVAAIRETADLTATVRVTGILSRPEISLETTPELPEDEIISRILFGRSASQLTTIETARLAAALAQLSGGGGFDLMGGLEDALGLDTLDFGQTETGQTQLTTGKYLSDNVYVEVRGAAEGTPGIAVEWTPRKNISIAAETAPGETQRLSVQWQKDFD